MKNCIDANLTPEQTKESPPPDSSTSGKASEIDFSSLNYLRAKIKRLEDEKNFIEKQFNFIVTLSSAIAHELRTPLAIINLYAELLENCLRKLLLNVNNQPSESDKIVVGEYFSTIRKVIKNTNYLIGNLLLQIKSTNKTGEAVINRKNFARYSIANSIDVVLTNYPFEETEKQLINFEKSNNINFEYIGDEILTNHILFNLIKNSLRAIKNIGKGAITIKLETSGTHNKLIFIDTASGIPKELISKIFDKNETNAETEMVVGTGGTGLAFCKIIMQSYSGEITCLSKDEEYTEFVLKFPRVL